MKHILALDPGNEYTGYVKVEHDGSEITKVVAAGKICNTDIFSVMANLQVCEHADIVIEMIAGMGMPVGQEVFDTCVWIGRFWEAATTKTWAQAVRKIYRREEKLYLCGSLQAKDANIRQALVDRYAPGQPNYGKGTKQKPGFFYGFSADMWAAMAVAVTYFDKYIKGVKL